MNLLKRLNNLWKLSNLETTPNMDVNTERTFNKMFKKSQTTEAVGEKPHMAQVISRRDPIKEALKND